MTEPASRRLRRAERAHAAAWGGLVALACGSLPAAPARPVPAATRLTSTVTATTPDAGATTSAPPERAPWVLFLPPNYWLPSFQRTTDDGILYAGPGNERWLVQTGRPESGIGPDAVVLAGALRADAGFAFITRAGAVYSARSPLGELSLTTIPSPAYLDAAAGRDHFLAIDAAGRLQRSADRGQSWQAVSAPRHAEAFSDVEMLETGAGLLLAKHAGKSQLFSTRDDGATWREVASEGRTFNNLANSGDELQPVVSVSQHDGYYQYAVLDQELSRVTDESRMFYANTPFDLLTSRPPDVAMLLAAGVVASGAVARPLRWVALRETTGEPTALEISVTAFGELPSYRPIDGLVGCGAIGPAAVSEVAVICRRPGTLEATLALGDPDGHRFRRYPLPPDPRALHALGDALVVQTPCDGPKQTRGPFLLEPPTWQARRVRDAVCRTHLAFTSAAEPDAFFSVAWSNSELTLHRWRAGDPKPELVSVIAAASPEPSTPVALARDGATLVVAVPTPDVWPAPDPETLPAGVLFRSDDAGLHFREVALPTAFRALGLSGRRGFGVGHDGQAWMTHDFGGTWTKVSAPRAAGNRRIECTDTGCLTARGFRIGWGP